MCLIKKLNIILLAINWTLHTSNGLPEHFAWGAEMEWSASWIYITSFAQISKKLDFVSEIKKEKLWLVLIIFWGLFDFLSIKSVIKKKNRKMIKRLWTELIVRKCSYQKRFLNRNPISSDIYEAFLDPSLNPKLLLLFRFEIFEPY